MSNNHQMKKKTGSVSSAVNKTASNIKNNNILTRFFSHNITLMVLSFVLAFTIWFIININSKTDSSETISNIPIQIELSDAAKENGLEVFRIDDINASVEVSGNRITVDSLTADDITVYATQLDSIITPSADVITRPLTARKTGIKNNYEIVSAVNPSSVSFRVDRRKDKSFTIVNNITVDRVDSSTYIASKTISPSTINVTGPEQEVNRIASAEAFGSVTVGESETTTKNFSILFRDVDGNLLNDLFMVTSDAEEVQATVIVYPTEEFSTSVKFTGDVPSGAPEFSFSTDTIKIAGPQEALDKIQGDGFTINEQQQVSFSELDNKEHRFEFELTAPEGCLIVTPDTKKIEATLDLSAYSKMNIQCTLVPKNIDTDDFNYEFLDSTTDAVTITVCGPESKLKVLSDKNMTAEVNFESYLNDIPDSGVKTKDIPVTVSLGTAYNDCWVYGTYKVSVDISKK